MDFYTLTLISHQTTCVGDAYDRLRSSVEFPTLNYDTAAGLVGIEQTADQGSAETVYT